MTLFRIALCVLLLGSASAHAAVSCTLDHPDQDVKRLFPESTSYRVRDLIPERNGSKDLMAKIQKQMGHELDKEFAASDTPYTFYLVYKGEKYIGIILGTNARATDGPMQLFVAYEPNGMIRDVYVQKISSPDASAFRSRYYRQQFRRFGLGKVLDEAYARPPVRAPKASTLRDHQNFVDGIRLNLLLVKYLYNAQ